MELSLDFVPKTMPEILLQLSPISDSFTKQSKLDDYVNRLEDEMRKIDAFKRELPLCFLLLQHAISKLKEEQSSKDQPVIEEFIPLKGGSDGESEKGTKKKWLSSAQLWNSNSKSNMNLLRNGEEDDRSVPHTPIKHWDCAFELFKDENSFGKRATKEDVAFSEVPRLTLMTQISDPLPAAEMQEQTKLRQQQQQAIRKRRRRWSPELHHRFVDALQRLGGSQVATPKQIRELMQVDGLTNDEKYRLQVRKLSPAEEHGGDCHSKMHAESPDGPLHGGGCGKALSITEGESMEGNEDAKWEGHSWKGRIHKHRD